MVLSKIPLLPEKPAIPKYPVGNTANLLMSSMFFSAQSFMICKPTWSSRSPHPRLPNESRSATVRALFDTTRDCKDRMDFSSAESLDDLFVRTFLIEPP